MAIGIGRRHFVAALGGVAAAWPLAARAQQTALPVVGFLSGRSAKDSAANVVAFRRGLEEAGYVEGKNVSIEYRWADGEYDRLPSLASDLVRRSVAVIATTGGTESGLAAKQATAAIPIVFLVATNPIELGLVDSYNRPSGNVTGVSFLIGELTGKRIELLHELVPQAAVIGTVVNPSYPDTKFQIRDAQAAANALGAKLIVVQASIDDEINAAFDTLAQKRVAALIVGSSPFFNSRPQRFVSLAARNAVPAIYALREFTALGGLMSYGASITDAHRQIGLYAAQILKGNKPADLPVQQAVKFEFVINLKTAKGLGITIPSGLLSITDEVIE